MPLPALSFTIPFTVIPALSGICPAVGPSSPPPSEEEQAAYVAAGVRLLLTYPNCMGFLFYSWGDDEICWHCGKPNCPSECSWGLTDGKNHPKPAYYAMQENVRKYNH